jgi:hypothetical protein
MAEDICHIFETRAVVDHLGGDCMAEDMAADPRRDDEAGGLERLPHDAPHRSAGQRAKRCPTLYKDLTAFTLWSPAL